MSRIRSLFTGAAIVAGSSAALLMAGSANAEPAPAPPVPGMDMLQQFVANPAGALQAASALLTAVPSALGTAQAPAPVAPPLATASLNVPSTPGALPVADAAAPALSVPSIPGVPMPAGVSLPPNLTSLIPAGNTTAAGIPILGNSTTVPGAVQPPTPAAPVGAGLGNLFPVAALP